MNYYSKKEMGDNVIGESGNDVICSFQEKRK